MLTLSIKQKHIVLIDATTFVAAHDEDLSFTERASDYRFSWSKLGRNAGHGNELPAFLFLLAGYKNYPQLFD